MPASRGRFPHSHSPAVSVPDPESFRSTGGLRHSLADVGGFEEQAHILFRPDLARRTSLCGLAVEMILPLMPRVGALFGLSCRGGAPRRLQVIFEEHDARFGAP